MREFWLEPIAVGSSLISSVILQFFSPVFAVDKTGAVPDVVAPVVQENSAHESTAVKDESVQNSRSRAVKLIDEAVKLIMSGDYSGAYERLEAAEKLDPGNAKIRQNRAIMFNNCGLLIRDRPQEALSYLHRALFLDPENLTTAGNLNVIITKMGRDPNDFLTRVSLANESLTAGDITSAIVEFTQALKLKFDSDISDKLGDLFRQRGDNVQAAAAFHKAALYRESSRTDIKVDAVTMSSYLKNLTEKIRRNWFPPKDGLSCTCVFEVLKDGTVVNSRVSKGSGSGYSDSAGLRAIERASPLPPLPTDERGVLCIEFKFDYNVNGDPACARIVPLSNLSVCPNSSPSQVPAVTAAPTKTTTTTAP